MRVIISPSTKEEPLLKPWIIDELGEGYQVLDLKEEKIFHQIKCDIEPDFEIQLGREQITNVNDLSQLPVFFVSIGGKQQASWVSSYYEMKKGKREERGKHLKGQVTGMSCYSEECFYASELIKTIRYVINEGEALKRRVVIYLDGHPKEKYFAYRNLAYKAINKLLDHKEHIILQVIEEASIGACYLSSHRSFEPYDNHFIYASSHRLLIQAAVKRLNKLRNVTQEASLYQDLFYKAIPMEEKLYLPLVTNECILSDVPFPLRTVSLGEGIYAIYDTKEKIEQQKEQIRPYLFPQFKLPITTAVSPHPINNYDVNLDVNKKEIYKNNSKYKGQGVYIGIVSVTGVNWSNQLLKVDEEHTRIACIWKQKEGDEGIYYTADRINRALKAGEEVVKGLNEGINNDTTFLLSVAGGKQGTYEALASETEFLIAQVQPAGDSLQQLYMGETNALTALVPDILIGAKKLVELARINDKPLVLCLPYYQGGGLMKEVNKYDRIFKELSYVPGVTLVIPVGEEADKAHQYLIEESMPKKLVIKTNKKNHTIVGSICFEKPSIVEVLIHPIGDTESAVSIEEEGIYKIHTAVVYSNGLKWDFDSGQKTILFRIEQSEYEAWEIECIPRDNQKTRIQVSLREQGVSAKTVLIPASTLNTMNSAISKWSAIGVGDFDAKGLVTRGGSGRMNPNDQVELTCVAEGQCNISPHKDTKEQRGEGTAVAVSLVTGAVAALYSKWVIERGKPYPNTKVMSRWLEQQLQQQPEETYPHLSQGAGLLDVKKLQATLMRPLEEGGGENGH